MSMNVCVRGVLGAVVGVIVLSFANYSCDIKYIFKKI